ncbi:MAG: HAD family phosphatase [Terrimicrobiaceae bacterium]
MVIELPQRQFSGYIFDCDGTLADTMPLHYRAWARVVEESGGRFPEELFYSWGGRPSETIVADLNATFGSAFGIVDTAERKEAYYYELLHEVRPIQAVVDIALGLQGRAPLAVASGGYRRYVELTLDAIGLTGVFPVIVCAEDYEHGKPHPAPFLETARRLGVPAGDCLVFEDSPAGLEAARRAGMECVCIPPMERMAP